MKKHVIITSADAKYSDFILNQWFRSLTINVRLEDIDVVVFDYGLPTPASDALRKQGVILVAGSGGGHIVTMRFIDARKFLENSSYDQVLFIDGGDIVFQEDIAAVFEQNKDAFRVTKLDMEVMYFEAFIPRHFNGIFKKELWRVLKGKPVLNAGVIFAPKAKFVELCEQVETLVSQKHAYGPDQVIVNYVLYQDKVVLLDKKYNFIFGTEREGFIIKDGVFYRRNGEKIAIAHNAGHDSFLRPITNFGYGAEHNQLKYFVYYVRRVIFTLFRLVRMIQRSLCTQWEDPEALARG